MACYPTVLFQGLNQISSIRTTLSEPESVFKSKEWLATYCSRVKVKTAFFLEAKVKAALCIAEVGQSKSAKIQKATDLCTSLLSL